LSKAAGFVCFAELSRI